MRITEQDMEPLEPVVGLVEGEDFVVESEFRSGRGVGESHSLPEDGLDELIEKILMRMASMGDLLVAFSGGVDSATVAALAQRALGDKAVAAIAVSETLPARELAEARELAAEIGIRLIDVTFDELANDNFVENTSARCYFCQSMRFSQMREQARRLGFKWVASGTNMSDFAEHRPGLKAMEEEGVYQPFVEFNVDKKGVRAIAQRLGLSAWNKPAAACLSSRIVEGLQVTNSRLRLIEAGEDILSSYGFLIFRLRLHGRGDDAIARLELDSEGIEQLLKDPMMTERLTNELLDLGFKKVVLDCEGYRVKLAKTT